MRQKKSDGNRSKTRNRNERDARWTTLINLPSLFISIDVLHPLFPPPSSPLSLPLVSLPSCPILTHRIPLTVSTYYWPTGKELRLMIKKKIQIKKAIKIVLTDTDARNASFCMPQFSFLDLINE